MHTQHAHKLLGLLVNENTAHHGRPNRLVIVCYFSAAAAYTFQNQLNVIECLSHGIPLHANDIEKLLQIAFNCINV